MIAGRTSGLIPASELRLQSKQCCLAQDEARERGEEALAERRATNVMVVKPQSSGMQSTAYENIARNAIESLKADFRRHATGDFPLPRRALTLNLNTQSLDLLIQRRQWNVQLLGRVGLAPVHRYQSSDDLAPLEIGQNLGQRSIGGKRARLVAPDLHAAFLQDRVWQNIDGN